MSLDVIGTLFYNTITFPVDAETTVEAQNVMDDAGRAVMYVQQRISTRCVLTPAALGDDVPPGTTTDDVMDEIRKRLMAPAGYLVFNGKGYGDLNTNNPSSRHDVLFGPLPKVLTWKPLGPYLAEVSWSCDVHVPECSTGVTYYSGRPLSITYTQDFSIDHMGYTSRTTTGNIVIGMTRSSQANKSIPDTADNYFDEVINSIPIPFGFDRTTNQRYLDYSKRICRFRVVDTEMSDNFLPPGVVECSASQTIATASGAVTAMRTSGASGATGFWGLYVSTIRMSITLAKTESRWTAFDYFVYFVKQRVIQMQLAGATPIPTHFSMEEPEVFGRGPTGRFSLSLFITVRQDSIARFRAQSALWLPTGFRYSDWYARARKNMSKANRGYAGLRNTAADDVIVDACCVNTPNMPGKAAYKTPTYSTNILGMKVICPPPDASSFISISNNLAVTSVSGIIQHNFIPLDLVVLKGKKENQGTLDNQLTFTGTSQAKLQNIVEEPPAQGIAGVLQRVATPVVRFVLFGRAARMCYPIGKPTITQINGMPVYQSGINYFTCNRVANFGVPIYAAEWYIEYAVVYDSQVSESEIGITGNFENGMQVTVPGSNQYQEKRTMSGSAFANPPKQTMTGDYNPGGLPN